jgi:uncharacterized protein (DUF2132 family)
MQLKCKKQRARMKLAAASWALLGAVASHAQNMDAAPADDGGGDWSVDSALAYYHEKGRIQAIEPIVSLKEDLGNGESFDLKLTFDSLSGASPNGALTSNKPQTFATPSGHSLSPVPQTYTTASGQTALENPPLYTVGAGQLPADPNYRDQRIAAALGWDQPLGRLTIASFGGKLSYEHDFLSASLDAGISRDFNQKNTTLSLDLNGEFDTINPIGGTPVAASDYLLFAKTSGADHKNGAGVTLGLTQVINQHWLTQVNLSVDRFSGYLNDPYKIISVLDAAGDTSGYLYERRPGERLRRSVYLENRVGFSRVSLALGLRYFRDDWGVHSETAELRLRWWNRERDRYLEPLVREYRQSAADFYSPWLTRGVPQPVYASADQRLAALDSTTFGLKYGARVSNDTQELSIRFEYYRQTLRERRAAPTALQAIDLYPGLQAMLVQIGWSF